MKPAAIQRIRRRSNAEQKAKQNEPAKDHFFGSNTHEPFFQPSGPIMRKCDGCAKEEKVNRSPEKKEEEKVNRAADEKKEEKLNRAADEKQEEKLQRAAATGEEEKVSRSADKEKKEEKLHKKEAGGGGNETATSNYLGNIDSKGQPMPAGLNHFYGSRMGSDFSNVKIHTGKDAAESASGVHAKAYAYGNNIVFNEGQYNPGSHEGKKLLAHELTHVAQNNGSINREKIHRLGDTNQIPRGLSCTVPSSNVAQQTTYLFPNDSTALTAEQVVSIRNIATSWRSSGSNAAIRVDGYASSPGGQPHNWTLSCERASRVKSILVANGVPEGIIAVHMNGETSDFGAEASNRRVNIFVNTPGPVPPPPPDPYFHPVPGDNECDDAAYCTPYATAAEIVAARTYLLTRFIPVLEGYFGSDVGALWRAYLSRRRGDSLAPRIFNTPGNSIYEAFSTTWSISDEVDRVLDLVASRLSRGYGNVTQRIENFINPGEMQLSTNFGNPFSIPGNIAGGIGSSDAGMDSRRITWGQVSFDITELPGSHRIVTIEAFVNFEVKDAIDFCPGQCGAILEQTLATIKMSKLEASNQAYDVPFVVRFPGPRKTKTILV